MLDLDCCVRCRAYVAGPEDDPEDILYEYQVYRGDGTEGKELAVLVNVLNEIRPKSCSPCANCRPKF